MGIVIGAILGSLGVFALVLAIRPSHSRGPKAAGWEALARQRGGAFEAGDNPPAWRYARTTSLSWWSSPGARHRRPRRIAHAVFTRARASFLLNGGPVFSVVPEGESQSSELPDSARDIVLGEDPAFDRRFTVITNAEEATREVWTLEAMRLARAEIHEAQVSSDGATVSVLTPGFVESAFTINRLIRFTWRGIQTDPGRLMAAANLLAAFTGTVQAGVYR